MNTVRTQRLRRAAGATAVAMLLVACWLLLRPTAPAAPPPPASLDVVNPTARTWTLRTTSVPAGRTADHQIGPGETRRLELPGGDYTLDQTLLPPAGEPPRTRTVQTTFRAGEHYRWTLLALPRPDLDGELPP